MLFRSGLYPTLQYRLTETKAPKNHHLLTEPAYEGLISAEDSLIVELTVVNAPIFTLPMTGAVGSNVVRYLQIAGACVLLAMLFRYAKKRR